MPQPRFSRRKRVPPESPDKLGATEDFLEDEGGTTAVEYAVMIALITAVCVGAVQFMAAETIESFERSGEAIQQATSN